MMICISTSNNLRDSVLHRAGSKVQSLYRERSNGSDALVLDGGLTASEKILFVPWETDIQGKLLILSQADRGSWRWSRTERSEEPLAGSGEANLLG